MKFKFHICGTFLCATMLAMIFAACSKEVDSPVVTQEADGCARVGLTISVGEIPNQNSNEATRAPEEGYDAGAGFENYIDIINGDFRILFFTSDDKYVGKLRTISLLPVSEAPGSKRYTILGEISKEIAALTDLKVVMLANWKQYPEDCNFDNIFNQLYDYNPSDLSIINTIPLYGVREMKNVKFIPQEMTDLGTIHLLRALAKIEVDLNWETDKFTLDKLQLTRYNKLGYCAPTGIKKQDDYVHNSWMGDYTGQPFVPANSEIGANLDFKKVGENRYLLYVPEFDNSGTEGEQRSRLCLNFGGSLLDDHYIDIVNRKSNCPETPVDILRNVWYRITINKKDEYSTPEIQVDVIPYKVIDLQPTFGLDG